MKLQITEVIGINQRTKRVLIKDGTTDYIYDGKYLTKIVLTKDNVCRIYDYIKGSDNKPIPKSMDKLVAEMDFLLDSLVNRDHVRAVIV